MIRTTRFVLLPALALLLAAVGCAEPAKSNSYSQNRGLYAATTRLLTTEESAAMRADGKDLEDRELWAEAAEYWRKVAYETPRDPIAIFARTRRIVCLVNLNQHWLAHEDMVVLIQLYKETLQLTRYKAEWEQLRRIWYESIGLGLYFSNTKRDELAENLDPAIKVFERLLNEEIRGKYAALCLLRIGDCHYSKHEYSEARTAYLRVVESYADFQDNREHEQAVYKAAGATLATMKGRDYNQDKIRSQGSETAEKGALDLCDDYDKEYRDGEYTEQVAALRSKIFEHLAWRDFEAAQLYDRLGHPDAAYSQYGLVVRAWKDYAALRGYVDRAQKRMNEIRPTGDE